MQTVESKIARFDSSQNVRMRAARLNIDPPRGAIACAAGQRVTLYDNSTDKYPLEYCHIQNLGTGTIKYALNSDVTTDQFHEILAPGAANNDGLGATVEFRTFRIQKITVISDAGSFVGCVLGKYGMGVNAGDLSA